MNRIEDLDVYKYAYGLAIDIYEATKLFPSDEKFGLVSQLRRASVSICANMSEGGARITKGGKKQFPGIARGSVSEVRLQVSLSKDLGFVCGEKADDLLEKIGIIHKMLTGLINK